MWALLVAATPLDHSGSIEVGVFGGYNVISEDSELGNAKNPGNVPESGLLLGGRGGLNLNNGLGAELEFKYVPTDYSNGGGAAPIMGFRGNGLVHFGVMGHRLRPFLLIGAGGEYLSRANDLKGDDATVTDVDFEWHLGVGAKYHVLDNLLLRLDARYVNIAGRNDLTSTNLEFMLGVSWWMEGKPADTDEDGLADRDDKCPEQAEDKDGFEDSDGCPEADNDQDGILDAADKCPIEAEDKDGFDDGDGCPDPDNDGDGFPDGKDKCPGEAESPNGVEDGDGCPDAMAAEYAPLFEGAVKGLKWKADKLDKKSTKVLEKYVEFMLTYDSVKISVEIHTSGKTPDAEKELAEKRGATIRAHFVDSAIDGNRIVIVATGADKPISQATGKKAWAENERIEIRIATPGAGK